MKRAVIFDMYETLVTLQTEPQCFSRHMAEIAGADLSAFRAAWRSTEDARMLGALTLEAALRRSLEECGAWSEEAYEAILRRRYASREIGPDRLHPQILPMLETLRRRGVRIGLITNCQSEEVASIRRSVLWPYFDAPVTSFETGVMKPDPAIFHLCMDSLGVCAADCLYVGDGGSQELTAARLLGLRAVQAVWYFRPGGVQPVAPLAEFPRAQQPAEIPGYLA